MEANCQNKRWWDKMRLPDKGWQPLGPEEVTKNNLEHPNKDPVKLCVRHGIPMRYVRTNTSSFDELLALDSDADYIWICDECESERISSANRTRCAEVPVKFEHIRQPPKRWTFQQPQTKKWVEDHLQGQVLNLFSASQDLLILPSLLCSGKES